MTDLTSDHRAALDRALSGEGLTDEDRSLLAALRDACPKPRWLPTEDGVAMLNEDGDQTPYYVRDGKVGRFLRPDGTLRYPVDPADIPSTWEPYVHQVTAAQIRRAADDAGLNEAFVRDALPALGCREVTR